MVAVGLAMGVTAINDLSIFRDDALLMAVSLATRGLLLAIAGFALIVARRTKLPRQQDRAFNIAHLGSAIAFCVNFMTRIPNGPTLGPLIANGTLLVLLYFAQRGPLLPRALVGGVVTATTLTVIFVVKGPEALDPKARLASVVALFTLHVVGIFSARSFEDQRRKRFEAERLERQARHELAVKMRELAVEKERAESMSRARAAFLAAMSHEFRTPMNAVIGLSDVLLDAPLASEHRKHVRTISDSARALLALLNDILDFAKIDAQKLTFSPAPFDLRRLAESVIDMLRPQARARSLDLTLDISLDVPAHLLGDDARLRQVLVNLVSNAIKFTERGGVTLRITAIPSEGGDFTIVFRVEDTGIGMAPDVIARLFRPFEQADGTTERRYGGTGLGLAISKQIVLAMGGDIHVESELQRGSVFSFALPLPTAASPPEPAVLGPSEDLPLLAILVVDDNAINRDVARAKFARLGCQVDLASSGKEAVEAASNKDYDVIFMDLHMPEMGGIEATVQIEKRLEGKRSPHIIAMTASVFEEDRAACRRAGMRDFVGKPIDLTQLDAVLRRVAKERGVSRSREASGATLAKEPLAKLRQIEILGEPHFFEQLCTLFLAEAEKRLPRMKEALGQGDARALEEEAHILKSSSAALGAIEMSEICGRVEIAAREGRIEGLGAVLDDLSVEHRAVERALMQEIQGAPMPRPAEA